MIMKIHFCNRNWVFFSYNRSSFSFYSLWKSGKQAISLVKHKYELLLAWTRQVFYILFRMALCISDFYTAIFQNVLEKKAYSSCLSPSLLFKRRMVNIDTFNNTIIMKQIIVIRQHCTIYIQTLSRCSDLCIEVNVGTRVVFFILLFITLRNNGFLNVHLITYLGR